MRKLLWALALGGVFIAVLQSNRGAPPLHTGIRTIDPPVAASVPAGKVEVIEFFHFGCRYCRSLEPAFAAWQRRQSDNVVIRRVPVVPVPQLLAHAKLYHALVEQHEERLIPMVFDAIHVDGNRLLTREQQMTFVSRYGLDPERFAAAFDSPSTLRALQADRQLWKAYGVRAVPMLVVQGKYSPEIGARPEETIDALDRLVGNQVGSHLFDQE